MMTLCVASYARLGLLALVVCLAQPAAGLAQAHSTQSGEPVGSFLDRIRGLATGKHQPIGPDNLVCRSESDAVADQVFRLHTQLMVASLACGTQYGDAQAYTRYRLFTQQHATLLRNAQATLIRSFARNGHADFDAYRTGLANDESGRINASSTLSYCRMRKARFDSLIFTNPDQFPGYARELAVRDRIYKGC